MTGTMKGYERVGGKGKMFDGYFPPFNTFIEEAPILFDCTCVDGTAHLVTLSTYYGNKADDPRTKPEGGCAADHDVCAGKVMSVSTTDIDEGVVYSGEAVSTLKNMLTCESGASPHDMSHDENVSRYSVPGAGPFERSEGGHDTLKEESSEYGANALSVYADPTTGMDDTDTVGTMFDGCEAATP